MQSAWKSLLRNRAFLLMVLPGTIWLLVMKYLPIYGNLIAFQQFRFDSKGLFHGIWHAKWVGFDNFKFLFQTNDAFIITRNTVLYNLVFIVLGLVFPVTIAVIVNGLRNKRMSKFYQTGIMLPHFLSWVVVSYFAFTFLSMDKGIINNILISLGLQSKMWYNEQAYWPFILTFAQVWKTIGYSSVIYIAAIAGIDRTYYEAAVIDGANKWQQIINVTIPHLKPLMIVLTILAVGHIFSSDFGLFYQVPRESGVLFPVTNVIDTYVYRSMKEMGMFSMSAAAGLYQSVVGCILVLAANYVVRRISKEDALF
ncbi:ABC transporter permease [Paenibacillus aceris]|uniref:Aldouronate transport system permease protein n=1 Tax=Paenibacillus aceris TaxID=869555 RepID=A0ABS4HXB8_9BACL|nr:ABC transporter permease subunit [Paenibacillus aceris]MBP1963307.1 putative aldouronate transport system permease protein [Paenibacillus aceris]NHW36186.1 sugar ABC transporter permease [Paenibacillus aceris]